MEGIHLPGSAYGIVDSAHVAHIRREDKSYCGKKIIGPVPTGEAHWRTSTGHADGQHCLACDRAYRAEHLKYPITYDF